MDLHRLIRSDSPWLHLAVAPPGEFYNSLLALEQRVPTAAVRIVRGTKATRPATLFDEFAAALQFPHYFGENWDALFDCLRDLSWLRASAIVLAITDALSLLDKANPERKGFATMITHVVESWTHGSALRPPRPFHVVFQVTSAEEDTFVNRWHKAGLELTRLT